MKKARLLLGLGVWVAILPHLGFPYIIKNIIFLLTGLVLMYTASVIYKQSKRGKAKETIFENFIENGADAN